MSEKIAEFMDKWYDEYDNYTEESINFPRKTKGKCMKKRVLLVAAILSALSAMEIQAGQLVGDSTGVRYINDDGSFKSGWHQEGAEGPWYYFGENGYAVTGWLADNGRRYYFRPESGQMIADRITSLGTSIVYRFEESGACTAMWEAYDGWMKDDVGWYYRNPGQSYAVGWKKIGGEWYYFDEAGYMKTGLINVDGVLYFLEESGAMIHDGVRTVNGVTYIFDSSGGAYVGAEAAVQAAASYGGDGTIGNGEWPYKPITQILPEDQKSEFQKQVDAMADSILAQIVNDSMTKRQKAEAIYGWIRGSFRYSGHSATRDWVQEAYQGLRRRHGDCYTYFAVSQELLTRCGIPCIEVIRYTDNDHYWNLVQLEDGNWYHFDTTPRRAGGYFCLWTDAQMLSYSASHGGSFAFDRSLYPPTP